MLRMFGMETKVHRNIVHLLTPGIFDLAQRTSPGPTFRIHPLKHRFVRFLAQREKNLSKVI